MKMVKAAVKNNDYKHIDTLFTYLMVNKEEEDLRRGIRNKIEAYSKIHEQGKPENFKQANDPLNVLFNYAKKNYDDLESLVRRPLTFRLTNTSCLYLS